jgi:hypothetical protein
MCLEIITKMVPIFHLLIHNILFDNLSCISFKLLKKIINFPSFKYFLILSLDCYLWRDLENEKNEIFRWLGGS